MAPTRISWQSLLQLSELDFDPVPPARLKLSDEIAFTLSILTAATRHDRKLLRCDENGALLVSDPWNGLVSVETDELTISSGAPDSYTATVENKGVLVATSNYIVKGSFVKTSGGAAEVIYIAPYSNFWYPGVVYSVTCDDVPSGGSYSFYVGITAFN